VEIPRKNLSNQNIDQLLYVLSQNKKNHLTKVNEKEGHGFFQSICKKNPRGLYDRFSKKLIKYLKLNLNLKLKNNISDEDLVIKVRDTFRSNEKNERLMVVGMIYLIC
jgi:hypothetical protein